MGMRIVKRDAELFLQLSKRLLEEGYCVRFRAGGTSMEPAINDGDALTVEPVEPVAVRPGDILLYRKYQRGIAHRVVDVRKAGPAVVAFLLRGDAKEACAVQVEPNEVVGKVIAIEKQPVWRAVLAQLMRVVLSNGSTPAQF